MAVLSESQIRAKMGSDFEFYAPRALRIRTKEGAVLPFELNQAQRYLHGCLEKQIAEKGRVRALILKGRQQGASTYTEGRYYWKVSHRIGVKAFILTHEKEATNNLFDMVVRYHELCPAPFRPSTKASNSKELEFDRLDSGYRVGTAGNKGVGRSSTIQYFHGSEVAFWPHADEHAKGVMQAIPDLPGTEVILESTANGIGNYFYSQCMLALDGESDYELIFIPWYWQEEYRKPVPDDFVLSKEEAELIRLYDLDFEQIMFRRSKIQDLSVGGVEGIHAFRQEYPFTVVEAFQVSDTDSLVKSEFVLKARHSQHVDVSSPLVVGVDPSRGGKDATTIVRRRGRTVGDIDKKPGNSIKSLMETVGKIVRIIQDEHPQQVFVDVGGLGAGIVDRLHELGYSHVVTGVNFGSKALNSKKYLNKRAEMWGEMNVWLQSEPCSIPDSDSLHGDLTAPGYKFNSDGQLQLESKDDIKKRTNKSPDEGDGLALTFAMPVSSNVYAGDAQQFDQGTLNNAWS